ncbi:hypothetical protein HOY82DRAFT_537211 [Tuber indicum]|nr:hypothetical protein HOY82DRAFT_537211 [Tuber indicum]
MKSITTIIALTLFALTVMADSDSFLSTLQGGLARRSTPLDSIPKLFVRQATCPSETPNVCDGVFCAQVCCNLGDGSYCLYGETCEGTVCCKVGKSCIDLGKPKDRDAEDVRDAAKHNAASRGGTGIAAALFVGAAVAAL